MSEHVSSAEAPFHGDLPAKTVSSPAPLSWAAFKNSKVYDALAALPLTLWYALCAWQRVPGLVHDLAHAELSDLSLHFILDKLAQAASSAFILAVLVFLLLRGPARARTRGLVPRLTAVFGTYLAMAVVFLPLRELGTAAMALSLLLIIGGVGFSVYALGHLGRSFSVMAEARRLVTDGPYAHIRHPLYLGEGVATIGLMLQYLSPLALALVALQLAFQMLRIANEERILARQFPEYRAYMARTARFIPGIY